MKKTLLVLVLVMALTFAFAATALAEHAPSNYMQWSPTIAGNAAFSPSTPHAGYAQNTVKCNVCHSVHRAPVMGLGIRNNVSAAWITASKTADTEMLLRSSVAQSCEYCHITTAIGAIRLFNGNTANRAGTAAFTGGWGHESMVCAECHAVHGAETFKGAATVKILKYTTQNFLRDSTTGQWWGYTRPAIPNIGNNVANHTYNDPITGEAVLSALQDEIYVAPDNMTVAAGNVPQFNGISDLINGVNPINDAVGADMKDLQVGAFCTLCHGTYASGSEFVVNLDGDSTLWGGNYSNWSSSTAFPSIAGTFMTKGHPVMKATTNFIASGAEITNEHEVVAWGDANTCRKCHDAGSSDAPDGAVVYNSWPHITPGYYRFMAGANSAADYAAVSNALVGPGFAVTPAGTGLPVTIGAPVVPARRSGFSGAAWCPIGAFINPASTLPTPNAASIAGQFPDMMIKGTSADPNSSLTIGRDGACIKCHIETTAAGAAAGVGYTF